MSIDILHSIGKFTLILCWTFVIAYGIFTLILNYLWRRIPLLVCSENTAEDKITVIVPVRNESQNIGNLLEDLAQQTYPVRLFEVLIMDDQSTDATTEIVMEFIESAKIDIRLISLPENKSRSPKKRAIENAIQQASGNLIITTDGDCRVGPNWLSAFASYYAQSGSKLISGPVTFTQERQTTDFLQTVEFSSLIGSGAASMSAGYPSMCNGANLMYEKKAFFDVGGFEGVNHIASGDDEFLMHKIAATFPGRVSFIKNSKAVVRTQAHQNLTAFFNQRKRWASKWKHYQSKTPLILAMFVFFSNFAVIMAIVLTLSGALSPAGLASMIFIKCTPEWVFLGNVLGFLEKRKARIYIPLAQIIYPFYVCFFGLVAQQPSYEWKGRSLR